MNFIKPLILSAAIASSGSLVTAQQTDFTTPRYGYDPSDPCADNKVKPDWFTEPAAVGIQSPEQRGRHELRQRMYLALAWEHIAETGRCGCEDEFPDPETLKTEIEAVTAQFTTDFSTFRDTMREYTKRRMAVVDEVLEACMNNGR